ncbi:MAG: hypothetical protein WDW38_010598 [Sanguina aurantia]
MARGRSSGKGLDVKAFVVEEYQNPAKFQANLRLIGAFSMFITSVLVIRNFGELQAVETGDVQPTPCMEGGHHWPASSPLQGHPHYEKIKELSSGSFGFVQMARCLRSSASDDSVVAIKFIERSSASPRYMQSEVLNHRLLRHPHVIEFKEVFLTHDHICIAMEFSNGGDLHNYVKRAGRLNERASRCFFQQLILGLDYCHRMGVVNRDMKLENTLLHFLPNCRTPLLKICDFGYSKAHHLAHPRARWARSRTSHRRSSPRGGRYDRKAGGPVVCGVMLCVQFFSLIKGDMLLRRLCACDECPVTAASEIEAMARAGVVSPECQDLLLRLLVADPSKRMAMGDILSHPWFLASLPSTALHMNDKFIAMNDYTGVQGEEEIRALLAVAAAPRRSHDTGAAAGCDDDENYDVIEDAIDDEMGQRRP